MQASCFSLSAFLILSSSIMTSSLCCVLYDLSPSLTGPARFHWPNSVNRLYVLRDHSRLNWLQDCGQSLSVILLFDGLTHQSAVNNSTEHWNICCPYLIYSYSLHSQSSGHKGKKLSICKHIFENVDLRAKTTVFIALVLKAAVRGIQNSYEPLKKASKICLKFKLCSEAVCEIKITTLVDKHRRRVITQGAISFLQARRGSYRATIAMCV